MRTAAILAALVATAACAGTPPAEPAPPPPAAPAPAPAPAQATAPAQAPAPMGAPMAQQQPVMPMADAQPFICGDGQLVTLSHDRPAGILRGIRGGETFTLQEQVGRTPPRFVTGSDSVDLDGDVAHLRRGREERQTCRRVPAAPVQGVVWGTLTKLDRMALPPGSRAKVLLVDAARADAPAEELGSTQLVTTGNQVPLHFLISYDAARITPRASPVLQARIEGPDGRLMHITDTVNSVPVDAPAPSPIELRLVRTGGE